MTHEDADNEPDTEIVDERIGCISVGGNRNPFDSTGEYFWKCARCGGYYLQYFHDMEFRVGLILFTPTREMLIAAANEQRQAWNKIVDNGATCTCTGRTHHKVPILTDANNLRFWI